MFAGMSAANLWYLQICGKTFFGKNTPLPTESVKTVHKLVHRYFIKSSSVPY